MAGGSDRRIKVWERLRQAQSNGISVVVVEDSPVLAQQEIDLGQMTVVTGTHGVGKSYLLRSIAALLPRGYGFPLGPPFFPTNIADAGVLSGQFSATYLHRKMSHAWTVNLSDVNDTNEPLSELGDQAPWTRYVEPSLMFSEYMMLFQEYGAFVSNNLTSRVLTPPRHEELESLRDILGRRYETFEWCEVNTDYLLNDHCWLPHVQAVVDGRPISTAQMSSGELWVHYVLWSLHTASPEQIVLIDEPESFLSPAAHRPFLDEIARLTLASKAQTIVATHSSAMIARTPASMIRVVTPGVTGAQVIAPASSTSALRMLGHEPGLLGIVLVEDDLARRIVKVILSQIDNPLAHRLDIIACGGRDKALATGRVLCGSSKLGVCVVLDGDQRSTNIDRGGLCVTHLPGDAPDEEVLSPARANPGRLAERAAVSPDDVVLALDALRFHPHQYWFSKLASSLGLAEETLTDHLISLWLQDDAVHAEATQVVQQIREALLKGGSG